MAKTALINKAKRKPKFKVRGYTRGNRCGRPHSVYKKFGRRAARRHQVELVEQFHRLDAGGAVRHSVTKSSW